MLCMKQAASRPRPPWQSAASGSAARSRFRSTPRSPSAARKTEVAEPIGKKTPDEELQRQIVDALSALCMAGALHLEPSMDDAVSNSQRGRDEPISVRGHRCVLA